MNKELMDYIKRGLKSGKKLDDIHKELKDAGWDKKSIDKAFKSVKQSFISKSETINKIFAFLKSHIKLEVASAFVFLTILIFIGWFFFFRVDPSGEEQFSLTAAVSDAAGIESDTYFILTSSEQINTRDVKKILTFSPDIDYEVDRMGFLLSTLNHGIKAQVSVKATSRFKIIPTEELKKGIIYRAEISSNEFADHEYGWAFQVKAAFQVLTTHPRDKATRVPTNTGIEIKFNRTNLINPGQYFQIEPPVNGRLEVKEDILVFISDNLNERKIYTVTIKKGLRAKGSDDELENDYIFTFETGEKVYSGRKPSFDFDDDFVEFIPGRNPVLEVSTYRFEAQELNIDVYRLPDYKEFVNSYIESRRWELGWTRFYRTSVGSLYTPDEQDKIFSFSPSIVKESYQEFIELPQELEEGYYLLQTSVNGVSKQAWLQITSATYYFSLMSEQSLFWVYDFNKKEPMPATQLSFFTDPTREEDLGSTNSEGLVKFSTPTILKQEAEDNFEPKFFKLEQGGYIPMIILASDNYGYSRPREGDLYWDYLSMDKPLYLMNDTLNYWGIVRGRNQDIRQTKVTVGIYKNYGTNEPLFSQETTISQFDTIQGELNFAGMTPGFYSLRVKRGDTTIAFVSVQIASYTKPAYQITVTPSRRAIFAGDKVDFHVKAEFFDGTPVSNVGLDYSGYWDVSVSGSVILDEGGEGIVSFTPQYVESQYMYYPRNFSFSFTPSLSEEGEIYGQGRVLVFGPDLYLQAFKEKQEGDTYKFTAKLNHIRIGEEQANQEGITNEYIGEPAVDHPLSVQIIKTTHTKVEKGTYYDPIYKLTRKLYDYVKNTEIVYQSSASTNISGEWSFAYSIPQENGALYNVVFSETDRRGRKIESSTYAYYSSYSYWKEFGIYLDIESSAQGEETFPSLFRGRSTEFSVNDEITLRLYLLEGELSPDAKILFYRYQNSLQETKIIGDLTYKEVFQQGFAPSVQYQAVVLGPYGFEESNSVTASFREQDNRLNIDITPDKEQYAPGGEVNLDLKVTDKEGNPISAEVNISVADEALFHVSPYFFEEDILKSLYENIYIYPVSGAPQYASLEAASVEGGGCFVAGTPIFMEGGISKVIEKVRVGDKVLTFAGQEANSKYGLVPAIVQGISKHYVDELIVINDSLKTTPEHRLWVNGKWKYAGLMEIGDMLAKSDGTFEQVFSVERQHVKRVMVYNIVVDTEHTYFAGGYFVHNEEKGGGTRSNFVDTASFQTVHTDDAGEASIQFTLPDNITSWRARALAYARDPIKAGEGIKFVSASLPFFVDTVLNENYLAGDKPILKVRLFGDAYNQNIATQINIFSDSLDLEEQRSLQSRELELDIGVLKQGQHKLVISAEQGELRDSVERKINVSDNYFKKGAASIYKVTNSLRNITGNQGGFTKLKFADAAKGKFYHALFYHTFSSGIRADQVVSSFYSQKLLAQYFDDIEPASLDLTAYHTSDGAIAMFPYSDNDLELSVKVADLASEFVFQDSLKGYFYDILKNEKADIHRSARALYGLASLNEPVLTHLQALKGRDGLNFEDKIYVALGLAKIGDKENARAFYRTEIRPSLRFEGGEAWLQDTPEGGDNVLLTATIATLTAHIHEASDTDALWKYIDTHDPEETLDILEETLVMKLELERFDRLGFVASVKFSYATNTRSDTVTLEKGQTHTLILPESELETLSFSNVQGNISITSFYEEFIDPLTLQKNPELQITREYIVNGVKTKTWNQGDVVLVRLDPSISVTAIDGSYQVVDYMPAGLKAITQVFRRNLETENICDPIWYPSKIVNNTIYFHIYKDFDRILHCTNRTINYYARVISSGTFRAQPAILQSLKNLDSLNITPEEIIVIR